jgi:hypothetical protein
MRLSAGRRYRHKGTGRVFEIIEISIMENVIEGGLSVRVSLDTCDDDNYRFVVGSTQIERWWSNLEEVEADERSRPSLAGKEEKGFPWCDACNTWHHPENPTCKAREKPSEDHSDFFTVQGACTKEEVLARFEEFSRIRQAKANTHIHTRDCWDDPGPGHGSPFMICNKVAGIDPA